MAGMFGSTGFEIRKRISLSDEDFRFVQEIGQMVEEARGNVVFGGGLQVFPEADQELGRGSLENLASVSAVKSAHLSLRMLVYVRYRSMGGSGN